MGSGAEQVSWVRRSTPKAGSTGRRNAFVLDVMRCTPVTRGDARLAVERAPPRILLDRVVVVKLAQAENEKRIINPVSHDSRYQSLYNLGISALSNNDYGKALAYFKEALEQDKNSADALMMIGYTQTRLGNPDDAIVNLKAVLKEFGY